MKRKTLLLVLGTCLAVLMLCHGAVLAADGIAKQHAQLIPLGDGLGVADLHSGTGTAVDERPVDPNNGPAPLAPGAQLRLGNVKFRVERR